MSFSNNLERTGKTDIGLWFERSSALLLRDRSYTCFLPTVRKHLSLDGEIINPTERTGDDWICDFDKMASNTFRSKAKRRQSLHFLQKVIKLINKIFIM